MGLEELLSLISNYSSKDKELIIASFEFASRAHAGGVRKSGEPYIIHPLNVAIILAKMHADADTISAGLLHDCIEDVRGITAEVITEQFNSTVAYLVEGVTKIDKITVGNDKKFAEIASNKKLIEFMLKDIRILIIKLADRLHNMRTLQFHNYEKQIEIAMETIDTYVPFAEFIGAYDIKLELEDLAFNYLNHKKYIAMVKLERELLKAKRNALDEVLCSISQLLNSRDASYDVKLQVKNYYGLYERLKTYKEPQNVHDLFQIKFLLDEVYECYTLRDNIKKLYVPIKSKIKDYIISPKTNMYRALHVSSCINNTDIVQFQITTLSLDEINSYGLTAIWKQRQLTNPAEQMNHDFKELPIYKIISEIVDSSDDVNTFDQEIKNNVLGRKIYVKTPKGDTLELPEGSTPIDFAYYIHTYVGDHFVLAKVNGEYVAPNYKLKNKDTVQIITTPNREANFEQLNTWCTTAHAKRSIKNFKRRELEKKI